jgi:hypothetical protein
MPNVTSSVVISHLPQVVWDYIVHPDHIGNVLPGIVSVDACKEPPYSPGDVWHGVSRSLGITDKWTGVFIRADAPKVMEFRLTESRFPTTTTDTLEDGPIGRMVDGALSRVIQRALAKHQSKLPAHIDAWALAQG